MAVNDYEQYKEILRGRLKEKRYIHSLAVADEAKRLALKYGCDAEKAYLAGLLHDITKNTSREEQLKILDSFGIMLDGISKNSEKLWHAVSGAAYIEYVLGITDKDIINAVRYHTTAKRDMSRFEAVLYLADFTSLDRDYDDVEVMRELVNKSMESAMEYALSYTVCELVEKKSQIHPDTMDAYNQIVNKEIVF